VEHKFRTVIVPALILWAAATSPLVGLVLTGRIPLGFIHLVWLRDASAAAGGGLWLSLGLRDLRRLGIGRRIVAMTLGGLVFLCILSAWSFYEGRWFASAAEWRALLPDLEQVEKHDAAVISNPQSTTEMRARASRVRAQLAYLRTGELLPVLAESGVESIFQPTKKEQDFRRTEQRLRALLPYGEAYARASLHATVLIGLVALVLGLVTPVRSAPAGY